MPPARVVCFRLVPEQSRVAIHATSSIHPIDGEATGLEGTVELALTRGKPDLTVPPRARVELAVTDLSSGNVAYDTEMRRRLDARRHPRIVGELTGAEAGSEPGVYRVSGDLAFHGATHAVVADVRLALDGGRRLEATWEQTIDIRDFGIKPPRVLMLRVHPEVRVEVDLVAQREPGD